MGFSRLVSLTVFQSSLFLFVHLILCLKELTMLVPSATLDVGGNLGWIVIGDALASYWPIFSLPPVTVLQVFSKFNLEQFPSHF